MTARKKLPAYGAALMERRRRGDHPLCVHLVYGFKWREPCECWWQACKVILGEHPLVALKPTDYAPGVYEWKSIVTGVQVCVFDQGHEPIDDPELGPPRQWWQRPLLALIGELAEHAADVELYEPGAKLHEKWSAFMLADAARMDARARQHHRHDPNLNHGWPHWWSAAIAEKNAKRRRTWCGIAFPSGRIPTAEPA